MNSGTTDRETESDRRQKAVCGKTRIVQRLCPLCNYDNHKTPANKYSLGQRQIKDCLQCSFTYITSAPDYMALNTQASWEKSSRIKSEWRNATYGEQQKTGPKTRWRLHIPKAKFHEILSMRAPPGNVVDLGCGDGGQFEGLSRTHKPFGIEILPKLSEAANSKFSLRGGYTVTAPCIEGLKQFPDHFFTGAMLRSYLEHELNPLAVLQELHRTLQPGGVALIKVPNYASLNRRIMGRRWGGFRQPDHLNYFIPKTLRMMAERAGFECITNPIWYIPTNDNMRALLRKNMAPGSSPESR